MASYFYLNLLKYQSDALLSEIYDIKSFMMMKLYLLQYIFSWTGNKPLKAPYVCVDCEKTHRAYVVNQDGHKIISFGFEFSLKVNHPDLTDPTNAIRSIRYYGKEGEITPQNISEAISMVHSLDSSNNSLYKEINFGDEDNLAWGSKILFEYVLMKEPSYLRFDHDTMGYKEWVHPLNHLDVNYSGGTYKIGLKSQIDIKEIFHLFNDKAVRPVLELHPDLLMNRLLNRKKAKKKNKKKGGKRN